MEALNPLQVQEPALQVIYATKDISADISATMIELAYTDFLEGESDTLDITVEDTLAKWINGWYPQHGDQLTVKLGYRDAPMLACGEFEIDEITLDGPPDVVRIRALATGVKRSVRTNQGRAYENTTLADIAASIARRNRLRLVGTIESVRIDRVTQVYETDLVFLNRLAAQYGYAFSVRGQQLVFVKRSEIKQATSVLVIDRSAVSRYGLRDKVHGVATASTVSYHDPRAKRMLRGHADDKASKSNRTGSDTHKLNLRAENDYQAKLKSDAALDRRNEDQTGLSLTMAGDTRLVAGVNIDLTGFGVMNGKYTVTQSRHHINRNQGYTCEIEAKRVRA